MESRLNVLVDVQTFWFTPPPGEPLDLDRFFGQKRSAVEALLQQRWPLSPVLQQRIATHQKHNSQAGFLCQMCFGLCLPSGLLTGTGAWDYDRDTGVLQQEVAAVLCRHLRPAEFDLREHIDSEASFTGGKTLFALYIS